MGNLKRNIQKLLDCEYPVFAINTSDIEERDGLVFADGKVLDDKNVKAETLGERRLKTTHKNLYRLNTYKKDIQAVLHQRSRYYIDSLGTLIYYEKAVWCPLRYHEISEVNLKGTCTVIRLKGINFPITVQRPPPGGYPWAGIIYANNNPWLLYDYAEFKLKDTRRKL